MCALSCQEQEQTTRQHQTSFMSTAVHSSGDDDRLATGLSIGSRGDFPSMSPVSEDRESVPATSTNSADRSEDQEEAVADGYVFVTEAGAAGSEPDCACITPVIPSADDQHTCGICLEPAGAKGLYEEGCSQGCSEQKRGSVLATCYKKMRMRLNSCRLPCKHVHCAPCWAGWVQSMAEDARTRGRTIETVRCPLCNVECPKEDVSRVLMHFANKPFTQPDRISSLLRQAMPTCVHPGAAGAAGAVRVTQGTRPLASTREEVLKRERAARQRAREEARLDEEELQEFHDLKREYGALAANYEYMRRRGERFIANPVMKGMETMHAQLKKHLRDARERADAACEAAANGQPLLQGSKRRNRASVI